MAEVRRLPVDQNSPFTADVFLQTDELPSRQWPQCSSVLLKGSSDGRAESSLDSDDTSWTRVGFLFHLKTRGCRARPTFLCDCLLLWLCSCYLFLSQWTLDCFNSRMYKNDTLSDSNIGHRTAAPPSLDPLELSGNVEKVMRISPCKTAVRCPYGSRSDQCSLIFLCGTWMCFFRGWGSADPSATHLSGSNIRGFLSLDAAAVLVRLSVRLCAGSNPATAAKIMETLIKVIKGACWIVNDRTRLQRTILFCHRSKISKTDSIWVFLYVNTTENPIMVAHSSEIKEFMTKKKESGWFIILSSLTAHLFLTEERLI